jgi:hypothetical protein
MWQMMTQGIAESVLRARPVAEAAWVIDHATRSREVRSTDVAGAVHEAIHALRDAGRALHALGASASSQRGTLVQISSSRGGVPKTMLPAATIDRRDALAEISAFATPCVKNAAWFVDGNFRRMDHSLHPGWSRAYAGVLEGGSVVPGDTVVVEP